ncbi:MAG: hypothetical protein IPP34_09660 [Bacteroidetes bacterium]|nr:hypothetical protein [Bacteroidota bacterium]
MDVGTYNQLTGESYGEIAANSRSMHKSQGFGVARARGPIKENSENWMVILTLPEYLKILISHGTGLKVDPKSEL